jgi:CHAT domain-containing protein
LARDDLRQAESIVRRLGYGGLERQTQGLMQGVESRRALVKSQQSHEKVLDKSNIFRPKQPKDVLVSEGFVTGLDNVPPQLTAMLQAAKRQEQQAGGFAQSSQARSLYTEGLLHEMQGRNDDALSWYRKAVDVLERDRRSLRDERSRGSFMEDRITIYYAAVLQLLQQRRHAEAFEMLERSRSRALTDLLASRKLDVGNGEEQTLYAEAATLRARIADAQGRLLEASGQGAARAEAEKALGDRINADEARYQSVLGRMAATAPRLHKLVESAPTSLAALQDSMRSERYETLQYLVTESAVILWHITPDSVYVRNVFLPRTHVMSKVAAVGNSLRNPGRPFDEATAGELFLYLVQPVLARLNSERLVIIPHEDLGNLPFQVLRNPADGRYFGERFQISYAPSATVLLGLRRSTNLGGASVAAFADPAVEGAAQEVQSIGKLFAGRRHVRGDALPRKQEVKGLVADFEVVHLAVHGSFDAGEPMLSYLKLARGAGDDGKLTAAEMFGLPLAKSRLVVLSACETGRVETTHANEMLGMSRALLYAGASALLLSQWRISSAATTQWMQTFYEAAVSRPPAEAARLASLQMMKDPRTSHPFYWAPFTLIAR